MAEYIVKETGYLGRLQTEIVGELVRCEDCRWWERESISEGHCLEIDLYHVDENHYCGFAERKEDEEG